MARVGTGRGREDAGRDAPWDVLGGSEGRANARHRALVVVPLKQRHLPPPRQCRASRRSRIGRHSDRAALLMQPMSLPDIA
eukprot:3650974-Rhodomonas_salina.2